MWTVNSCVNILQSSISFALSLSSLFTFHRPKCSMWWWSFVWKFNSYSGLIRLTLNTARLVFFKYPLKRRFFLTQLEFFISILFGLFSTCVKHVQLLTVASCVNMNSIIEIRDFFYFSAFHAFLSLSHTKTIFHNVRVFSSPFSSYWIHLYHATVNIFILYFHAALARAFVYMLECIRQYYSTDTLSSSLHTCYFTGFFTSFQSI